MICGIGGSWQGSGLLRGLEAYQGFEAPKLVNMVRAALRRRFGFLRSPGYWI